MGEAFLLIARKTNSTQFWEKLFPFQRNLGFDKGAVEKKKGESTYGQVFTGIPGKTCNQSPDFPGKKRSKKPSIPKGLSFSLHGSKRVGAGREEETRR